MGAARAWEQGGPLRLPLKASLPNQQRPLLSWVQGETCNAWDVSHYPTLKIARAADFAAQAKDKLAHLDARDAQGTVNAISKHVGM